MELRIKLRTLKRYFEVRNIPSKDISPNLVSSTIFDHFESWSVTSDDVIYLSSNL